MHVSRFWGLLGLLGSFIQGGWSDYFYRVFLFLFFLVLLEMRFPYIFGFGAFLLLMVYMVGPLFVSLLCCRVFRVGLFEFFASFVPADTPLVLAPFICVIETVSYVVRPVIMVLRVFINISIGSVLLYASCFFSYYYLFAVLLWGVVFLYEIFVALLHWFILCSLMAFSEDH